MADFETAKIKYKLKVLMSTGEILDLTGLCTSLSFGDSKGAVAQKADISIANIKTEKGFLSDLIKLCTKFFIYANDKELFRGIVWEWKYSSALEKEISITAYDELIYRVQSKCDGYYTSGKSTQTIVEDICAEWGIPVLYKWESHTHGKIPIQNKSVMEHITSVLDEAQTKLESKYNAIMSEGVLQITARGSNSDIFVFHGGNVLSTSDSLSLQNLVTKVIIIGKAEEDKRPSFFESHQQNIEYGIVQEIVTKDTNTTLDDARKEAKNILEEKSTPIETISVSAVDVPTIRKGYKIKIVAGNLNGYFYVDGVTHDGVSKVMQLELSREGKV